jgi:Flp pilus assembly protein TadD
MTSTKFNKLRLVFGLMAGAASLGTLSVGAQAQTGPTAYREDAGTALTRHLRSLADNPRSLHALMGAAEAALELGDPQAAITFFARAEEVAPRDPRVKAGFGSAFLQMEQPQSALKFFMDARSLGIAESSIAGDRGLAYDLLGDPKQAQQDYRLALRVKNDPEIERRLALSLAITGDKAGAMAAIHNQLQRQDRAAWRTRAFILALTGDAAGATQAVRSVMPGSAAAMQPFLSRLTALDAAGRAKAVHFGHMPAGIGTQVAQAAPIVAPPSAAQAGQPDSRQAALGARTAAPAQSSGAIQANSRLSAAQTESRSPSRRQSGSPLRAPSPGQPTLSSAQPAERKPEPSPTRIAAATPRESQPQPEPSRAGSTQLALSTPAPAAVTPSPISPPASASTPSPQPAPGAPARESFGPPAPGASTVPPPSAAPIQTVAIPESRIDPAPTPEPEPRPAANNAAPAQMAAKAAEPTPPPPHTAPRTAEPTARPSRPAPETDLAFADVIKAIEALPTDGGAAKPAPLPPPAKPKAAPKAEPAPVEPVGRGAGTRHWVQIASAPDNLVDHEYRRLKRKHPSLLSDKEGYRTPMGQSNRVLVGPFDTEDDAKAFVGELKKDRLTAIAWTSPEGHGIDKIPPK